MSDDGNIPPKKPDRNPITEESAENARAFWSSLQNEQKARESKAKAKAALAKIKKIAEQAAGSMDDAESTADSLRTHGVIHYPKNKT